MHQDKTPSVGGGGGVTVRVTVQPVSKNILLKLNSVPFHTFYIVPCPVLRPQERFSQEYSIKCSHRCTAINAQQLHFCFCKLMPALLPSASLLPVMNGLTQCGKKTPYSSNAFYPFSRCPPGFTDQPKSNMADFPFRHARRTLSWRSRPCWSPIAAACTLWTAPGAWPSLAKPPPSGFRLVHTLLVFTGDADHINGKITPTENFCLFGGSPSKCPGLQQPLQTN